MIYDDPQEMQNHILLAIAERLEALVEAQKPRWVEFEFYTDNEKAMPVMVDANKIILVNQHDKDTPKCYLTFSEGDSGYQIVKGTYAEVMAKLRGGA